MQCEIYPIYELLSGQVCASNGLSEVVIGMIGMKQAFALTPTFFNFYIDEVSGCIEKLGSSGALLGKSHVHRATVLPYGRRHQLRFLVYM